MTTAHLLQIEAPKSYATRANAQKAVEKTFGANHDHPGSADLWYVIIETKDGRFAPLFIGQGALQAGVHFHFNVATGK